MRNQPDSFFSHEALDRTAMVANILDAHLLDHPWLLQPENADVLKLIEDAGDKLQTAYQLIGNRTIGV